jgi:hypothetical protein
MARPIQYSPFHALDFRDEVERESLVEWLLEVEARLEDEKGSEEDSQPWSESRGRGGGHKTKERNHLTREPAIDAKTRKGGRENREEQIHSYQDREP